MSILITGGTKNSRLENAKSIVDAVVYEVRGVEEVRNIEKNIFLGQSAIIKDAQDLTIEAQNAFLKTLEEPPENVEIILLAENEDQLLPTILSRVQIINLGDAESVLLNDEEKEILKWIEKNDFISGSTWSEKIKNRDDAIKIIDHLLCSKPYHAVRKLLKAKKYLKSNTNLRLTLENLFID